MSIWRRTHLDHKVTAVAAAENNRFFVYLREADLGRQPINFYRWNLEDAKAGGDRLVQAYYPHNCDSIHCPDWQQWDY